MNRKQRRLARRIKRTARRHIITVNDHCAIQAVCADPAKLDRLQDEINLCRLNPYDGGDNLMGLGWKTVVSNLWDWFRANWPAILKLIITIAPLLLEPKHEDS